MRHLYSSRCEVLRQSGTVHQGIPTVAWQKITDIVDTRLGVPGEFLCRLDVGFLRPGRDMPMPIVGGRAPDRVALLFYDVTDGIKAGDRVRTLAGPVTGTFEIRVIPEPIQDFGIAHHMEVQVVEVAAALTGQFPGGELETT